MKRLFTCLVLLSLVSFSGTSYAQDEKLPETNIDLQSIIDRYEDYFASLTEEQRTTRGSGYKPFKRWQWLVAPRLNPDGTFPKGARWNAFQDVLAARQSGQNQAPPASWVSLGPSISNVNSAGRMLDLAFDPVDANTIWAGSASGGLWKTTDDGGSWAPVDDLLPTLAVGCVVVHNANPDIIYIGTGEGMFNGDAVHGVGVLKSTDGGATWHTTGLSWQLSQFEAVNEMVMHPTNPDILIAATRDGVWRTTNAGVSWTNTLSFGASEEDAKDIVIDPVNPSNVYVALGYPWGDSNNGVWKSTNNGVSWFKLALDTLSSPNMGRTSIAIHAANPSILYAGVSGSFSYNGSALAGVYKTINGGATWTLQATSPNFYSFQGWYNNIIAVSPVDPDLVYSGGVYLYRSTNGGVTWQSITSGMHVDQHALAFRPGEPTTIYAGNDGGVYKSTNGGSKWNHKNDGLTTMQFYAMGSDPNHPAIAYGGTQDQGTNKHFGSQTWAHVLGGDGGECNVDYTNSNIVYGEYQRGNHRKSTNGGSSWSSINVGLPGTGPWVAPVEMDPVNPQVLYTIAQGDLYKTTNGASNWSFLFSAPTELSTAIKVAPSDPQTIYVSGSRLYGTSNGVSFADITPPTSSLITSIAVHPDQPTTVYACMSRWNDGDHVYRSYNGGVSWDNVTHNLPNIPCNSIVIDPDLPMNVYVGTDLGVYMSEDGGESWSEWNDGLPNVVVDELDIHAATRVIRAATHGRGMYQSPLVPTSATGIDDDRVPGKTVLRSVYPNPFNPVVTIVLDVAAEADVRVMIYDVQGRLIRRLSRGVRDAGTHELTWDTTDDRGGQVASGVYLVRVESGGAVDSKKMVLTR